ncbi:hypothetical protein IQ260_27370 [Leptolyngbya cf. ectocarpi LEGE 11479]|uniref:Uncharacterized protein n=1 Tax=Leptolyngbya cf. ectocarpi LEGE 11479 TaxID=1828722 RepID=A0A928ZZS2_LEPEC|nr:hypothetical protein [Leptolyngbya ectocarpi]MBE9070368.1 hypothetical protein [Leptolyngbya cf. ectocarpi LEGE 11479]
MDSEHSVTNIRKKRNSLLVNILALVTIFSLCFFVFFQTGLLFSGFNLFLNDHLMITMHHEVQQIGLWATVERWLINDYNHGRFQPFYYFQDILLTQIFGVNANLWFAHTCVLASLTTFALFAVARNIGMSLLTACIFPAFVLVGPQAIMWAQPSYPQVIGTFLLAIAMLLAVIPTKVDDPRQNLLFNILFVLFVLLTSLSKESYIIFIPALMAIRIWAYAQTRKTSLYNAAQRTLKTNAILLGIVIVELLYISLVIGVDGMGYAGIQEETFQVSKFLRTIHTFLSNSYLQIFGISFLMSLILLVRRRESISAFLNHLLPAVSIAFLIISPQILLYTKSDIRGYYLIPATIGSALLITYCIHLLSSHSKLAAYLLVSLSIVLISTNFSAVWKSYTFTAYDNRNINSLLQQTQNCTTNQDPILVVSNPRVRYEASLATRKILNYVHDRQNLILATYGLEGTDFYSEKYRDAEAIWSFIDPQYVSQQYDGKTISAFQQKQEIMAVIVFDGLDEEFLTTSTWFKEDKFEKSVFPITFAPANLYCKI